MGCRHRALADVRRRRRVSSGAQCVGAGGAHRTQGMATLRFAAQGGWGACRRLVDRPAAARHAACRVRRQHGRPGRGRRARGPARPSARVRRCRFRTAADSSPDPSGAQRQPRRSHRGLAVRQADRRLRAAARPPAPRRPDADGRSHGRARIRRRHDRSSPVDFDSTSSPRGLVETIGGIASAIVLAGYAWWAPLVLAGGWMATHYFLRESAVWRDRNTDEVRAAQRDAEYAYRLAVDPPASKELRLFGLADWTLERFTDRRTRLHELQYAATRLRERPVIWSLLLVVLANLIVFLSLGRAASCRPAVAGRGRRLRADRHRRVDDRLRRFQLGARWRVRAVSRRCSVSSRRCGGRRTVPGIETPRQRGAGDPAA